MLRLFDATAAIGSYRTRVFRFAPTAKELLVEMDRCGIDRALVYHTAQRFDSPTAGNEYTNAECKASTRLIPTWTVVPAATGEQPTVEDLVGQMRAAGVGALRLFPNDHRYFLDDVALGGQLDVFAAHHIPVFIKASLDRIATLLRSFPALTVITDLHGANLVERYAWPLIDAYENLYLEVSNYAVDGAMEEFCRRFGANRLVFSSGIPDCPVGAALMMLRHAEISEGDRQMIAYDNMQKLLGWLEA